MATADNTSRRIRARLVEKVAESLTAPIQAATPRTIHGRVSLAGKASAVIGMRRAGKTTFLHKPWRERLEGGVARERLPYLNFEDEQLVGMAVRDLGTLIEEFYRRYPSLRGRETVTWCFDEVQVVDG